jgi:hypothetical protein
MLLMMMFKLPNGFLAAFYALAISRGDARSTVRNGFRILLANIAALVVSVAGVVLFIDFPLPHFLFVPSIFFLAFFLLRTLTNYATAFGFSIIVVAAASVPIIWARPRSFTPDLETTVWTAFGIMLGTFATVLTEWIFAPLGHAADKPDSPHLFVIDAFSNPEYVTFALKGCLAASLCYVFWSAVDWPGLGVCTVTCVIAAPIAVSGSSRRRLTTRLAGLFTGGVICGIGSQIFILPWLGSIVGFTVLFAVVSAAAAWFVTSSPRLNYFGRQMALAFYLTMFQGFGVNTSLTMSRDRLTGILLGVLAMWLVFDVAWRPAPGILEIQA